jgi:hypothetical protein
MISSSLLRIGAMLAGLAVTAFDQKLPIVVHLKVKGLPGENHFTAEAQVRVTFKVGMQEREWPGWRQPAQIVTLTRDKEISDLFTADIPVTFEDALDLQYDTRKIVPFNVSCTVLTKSKEGEVLRKWPGPSTFCIDRKPYMASLGQEDPVHVTLWVTYSTHPESRAFSSSHGWRPGNQDVPGQDHAPAGVVVRKR